MIDYLHGVELTPLRKLLFTGALAGGKEVEDTATGNPLTFITDLARPLKSVLATWQPHQSGTGDPSPENVRSISGMSGVTAWHTGKNLFDKSTPIARGQYYSADFNEDLARITTDYISIKPNVDYMISIDIGNTQDLALINYNYFDKDKTWLGNRATNGDTAFSGEKTHKFKITDSSAKWVRITVRAYSSATLSIADKTLENAELQLELGSTATSYAPYSGTSYSVAFPDEAGTVYGGTLDFVSGVLTAEKVFITWVGDDSENYTMDYDSQYGWRRFRRVTSDGDQSSGRKSIVCNMGVFSLTGNSVGTCFLNLGYVYYYAPTDITSVEDFKTWLQSNNLQFVYPLATPVTYQLTPQQVTALIGDNTIWSDANGTCEVTYLKKG